MSEPIITQCPCCGQTLSYYQSAVHPKSTRPPTWIGTCTTAGCQLNGVTKSDAELYEISQNPELRANWAATVTVFAANHPR